MTHIYIRVLESSLSYCYSRDSCHILILLCWILGLSIFVIFTQSGNNIWIDNQSDHSKKKKRKKKKEEICTKNRDSNLYNVPLSVHNTGLIGKKTNQEKSKNNREREREREKGHRYIPEKKLNINEKKIILLYWVFRFSRSSEYISGSIFNFADFKKQFIVLQWSFLHLRRCHWAVSI